MSAQGAALLLRRRRSELTNAKLEAEIARLKKVCEPESRIKGIGRIVVAAGGFVTILATLIGIYYTFDKALLDREQARESAASARFESGLVRLEQDRPLSKLLGLSSLQGFVTDKDPLVRRQTLFALAGFLATQTDDQTQTALVDLIASLPADGALPREDWAYLQGRLVSQNRALVLKGGLFRKRKFTPYDVASMDERTAHVIGWTIALIARRGVVPEYTDYSEIYCAECDFRNVAFPDNVNFSGALLEDARFNSATMRNARFDNAELLGVEFVQTDLAGARFRSTELGDVGADPNEPVLVPLGNTLYVIHLAQALRGNAYVTGDMPNFSCANLTGAQFDGHALFPVPSTAVRGYSSVLDLGKGEKPPWYASVPRRIKEEAERRDPMYFVPLVIRPPKFFRATLDGADFRDMQYYSLARDSEGGSFQRYTYSTAGEFMIIEGYVEQSLWAPISSRRPRIAEYEPVSGQEAAGVFQRNLKAAFHSSNWKSARLPPEAARLLEQSQSLEEDYKSVFVSLRPSGDPDAACKPRT